MESPARSTEISVEEYQKLVEASLRTESGVEFDQRFAKAAANWITGPITAYLNKHAIEIDQFPVKPDTLYPLICYVEFTDLISFNIASTQVLEEMIKSPEEHPWSIMERLGLIQENDEAEIHKLAMEVINRFPDKLSEYRKGKVGLAGFFTGELMRAAGKGKINPKLANEITKKILDQPL